jgi:hypothetical protein
VAEPAEGVGAEEPHTGPDFLMLRACAFLIASFRFSSSRSTSARDGLLEVPGDVPHGEGTEQLSAVVFFGADVVGTRGSDDEGGGRSACGVFCPVFMVFGGVTGGDAGGSDCGTPPEVDRLRALGVA